MLSTTAKTSLCTMFAALANAGLVRPEDQSDFKAALAALQAEVTADEDTIADLVKRVAALEDVDNGEEQALDPAPAAPVPTAVVSTDPAHSPDGENDGVIITQDSSGTVLATPIQGAIDPDVHVVTVDPDTGVPAVTTTTDAISAPTLDPTVEAPAGTPAPDDQAHVDANTSTVVATADPEPVS